MDPLHLAAAGNVIVPAYLALRAKGYTVTRLNGDNLQATGPLGQFFADAPILLLGLVALAETRGEQWMASDEEIEAFLTEFDER